MDELPCFSEQFQGSFTIKANTGFFGFQRIEI